MSQVWGYWACTKLSAFCVRLGGSSRAVVLHLALCPYPLLGAILGGSWIVTR